jgi:transposase-like protein
LPVTSRHFENKARRSFWLVHIEAWQRSGVTRTEYCRQHRLTKGTLDRWLGHFAGEDAARKQLEYLAELRRQQRLEAREKLQKKRIRRRYAVSTDMRNRAVQAFWAMHVEAMTWSGMSVRDYATALFLSPTSLRKWRDRLDDGEVEVDWRAHLHPAARPVVGTSAGNPSRENGLTTVPTADPQLTEPPARRYFTDAQKEAIAVETAQPGATVSGIARKHGIVTGLLFRWRVQFGVAQKTRARLAPVVLADGTEIADILRELLLPTDEINANDLADELHAVSSRDNVPDAVRTPVEIGETAP